MKKFITILSLTLFSIAVLSAQPNDGRQHRPTGGDRDGNFTEFQIQVLTKQLHLEEKVVGAFTKLYTEYTQKMDALQPEQLQPQRRQDQEHTQESKPSKPTTAEVEAKILESFDMAEKSTALKRDYYYKFKEILSPQQILKMYNIERRLRERIVSESDRRSEVQKNRSPNADL